MRAEGPLNVLVNYWWGRPGAASPFPALVHAIMAVRDLPGAERRALRNWFDQYVFGEEASMAADHLPPTSRGVLGPATPARDAAVREYLLRAINRE